MIHSYRCRYGYAAGDPSLEAIERRLAAQPRISVPTIVLHGGGSALSAPESSVKHAPFFTGPYQHRVIPAVGPQSAAGRRRRISPDAVLDDLVEAAMESDKRCARADGEIERFAGTPTGFRVLR